MRIFARAIMIIFIGIIIRIIFSAAGITQTALFVGTAVIYILLIKTRLQQ